MTDPFHFSKEPCELCGWHHQLDAFPPSRGAAKTYARTLVDHHERDHVIPAGSVGWVREWSQHGGPVYVRLQFEDVRDEYQWAMRSNYAPCELEHP
jgi:hypothetical protein